MRKFYMSLLSLLFSAACLLAQTHKIEKSEPFDEPDNGYNKVLLLKNGNTFFFHFARKEGIEINVYNKERKVTATQEVSSEMWDTRKMKRLTVAGLYEINNEAVLFIIETEGRTPTLYRLRFKGTDGSLIKEEEIGSSSKSKLIAFTLETNSIFIEKDPESDCYAIIFFNGYTKDPDDRIRVIHYDGNHNKINTAYYESPDEDFKYLRFIGAVVDGSHRVFISSYGARALNGKDGRVYISVLKAGEKTFGNKALKFTEDFKDTKSVMAYNRGNNSIQLLTLSFARGSISLFGNSARGTYVSFMSYIDPETLDLKSVKPIAGMKINEYAHTALNTDLDYKGLPQNMIINKDNSTTVVSEELVQQIITERTQNGTRVIEYTFMGGIGVNELNADGSEKSGYWIRKQQRVDGLYDPLYISARSKGRWTFLKGYADHNSYMSYDYINTENNRYIIFNDNNKNFDKDEDEEKRKVVKKVNKLNTICYSLNGTGINKSFLFGDTGDKDLSNSVHIDASDFDKQTGTYCTIMVERDRRDRSARMVWITFE
jgi:hypothetical protein